MPKEGHSGSIQTLESPQTLTTRHCAILSIFYNSLSHGRETAGGRGLHCLTWLGGPQSLKEGRRRGGPLPHTSHLAFTYFSKSLLIPNSKGKRQPLVVWEFCLGHSFLMSVGGGRVFKWKIGEKLQKINWCGHHTTFTLISFLFEKSWYQFSSMKSQKNKKAFI